jgi:hypothetical protein
LALCTQLDVEQKLQWDITAEPDSTVTALIADAQAHIEAEVGRELESDDYLETYDGGRVSIQLKHWPVTAVDTVTEDGTVLTANDDYLIKGGTGRLIRVNASGYQKHWNTYKPQSITVEYTGGYLTGTHDSMLEHLGSLCAEVVARAFKRGADNAAIPAGAAGSIQSVALEGSDSVTYQTGDGSTFSSSGVSGFITLTEDERRQLNRYDRLSFGFA